MLILTAEEQRNLINMEEVIDYVADALKEFSSGKTVTPIRAALPFQGKKNTFLVMPSVAEGMESVGLKVVTVAPNNKKYNKKTINGVVMLSDFETGEPLSLLEGSHLTMVRTGILSGLATKYLSRKDSKKLCVIGTGKQAEGLVASVLATRDIEEIFLYNRTEQKAREFAEYLRRTFNKDVHICLDPNEAVKASDIVVTTTNSLTPVFKQTLKPGTHVNAVGSFRPEMQELPSHAIFSADKVVVESEEAALEETGDLLVPIQEESFNPENIYAELGKIISGEVKGRENNQEITVFESVGIAVVDIIVAQYLYNEAVKNNIGTSIQL